MKLVYGRAGSGKSYFCMNEIKECLNENLGRTYIYIVPEQYSLAGEFELSNMLSKNGTINIQVLSFKRLSYRVFSELGFNKNAFSKASKAMLVYHIMLEESKNLTLLKGVNKNRGLVDTVTNMISEFKRYNVSCEDLKNIKTQNKYLEMKLHDLSIIYGKFEKRISENYIDTDSRLTVLSNLISKSKMLKEAKIWIDGFDSFTPQEFSIVSELDKVADVTVTLTLYKSAELFSINQKCASKLEKFQNVTIINLDKIYRFKTKELLHLEENIFKYPPKKYLEDIQKIHVTQENSPDSEIENVAKEILNKIQKENYRYENIAILTKNIDSYKTLFNRIFKNYNIPYFFDDKKELAMQPLLTLVLSLFDIISKNFAYENVFNYLKTGLTNVDDINDIDILENYILQYGIKGNKWLNDFELADPNLEKINLIRKKVIDPILDFKDSFKGKKTAKEIATALYQFLVSIKVYEKINNTVDSIKNNPNVSSRDLEIANTYVRVWNIFMELLDELVDTLENEQMSFDTFKNILIEGISMHQIGILPTSNDNVMIGDISRTRNSNVKILFVIGVNDGVFPMPFSSEGFLSDDERDSLLESGVELAKNTKLLLLEENFNIYKALTTPSEEIYISFPTQDSDGSALRASSIINQLKNIFPKLKVKSNIMSVPTDVYTAKSSLNDTLYNLRKYYDGEEISEVWKEAYLWYLKNNNTNLLKAQSGLDYTNTIEYLDKAHSQKLYGAEMNTSVSRLETFANCPYMFYLKYGLKLKERKVFKLDTPDIGLFLHEIIDRFSEYVIKNNISLREIKKDETEKIVSQLVDELLVDFKNNIFNSSSQMKRLVVRLKRVIKRVIWVIVNHIRNGEFEISGSEVEFGKDKSLSAVEIELSDGNKLLLNGKIDRIDIAKTEEGKFIRIIDYKSYNKELKLSDIYYGLQLQLLVYLDAAMEKDLLPGGMLYLKLDDPIMKTKKNISKEEIEEEINKKLRMKGVILSDARLIKAMDTNMTNESSVLDLSVKKDGTFTSKVPVATKEQFTELRNHMKKILKQMGDEILNGNIKNEPVKKKSKSACEFCDYKLICRFDKELGNKFKIINDLKNDQVFEQLSLENM